MSLVLSLLCALNGCMGMRDMKPQPDQVLFDRANHAMGQGKYDVARLSLQTLINTYPDSDCVPQAKELLKDPRVQHSDRLWCMECDPQTK